MVFQDHMTIYIVRHSLKTAEATMQIIDSDAPNILLREKLAEFTASIISKLKDLSPECKIVYGKPKHSQSQNPKYGQSANTDIKDLKILKRTYAT